MSKPMTVSCITSRLEKQMVLRVSRLISVLRFKFLRSIFSVLGLPISCLSESRWREYIALAELDSNHDGQINAQDPAYATLQIWQDKNGDSVLRRIKNRANC
jgi:hypothetical protein